MESCADGWYRRDQGSKSSITGDATQRRRTLLSGIAGILTGALPTRINGETAELLSAFRFMPFEGSDGTRGIQAIKEGGGLTISEAAFDRRAKFGMPQSASASGFVDYVLQPQEMLARLLEYRDFKYRKDINGISEASGTGANHLVTICAVLNSRLSRDFGQYKSSTMMRRVRRRMQVLHIEDPNEYIAQLRKLPNEPELLFREILIGVTRFFRDPTMFEALAETVLPNLISGGA